MNYKEANEILWQAQKLAIEIEQNAKQYNKSIIGETAENTWHAITLLRGMLAIDELNYEEK